MLQKYFIAIVLPEPLQTEVHSIKKDFFNRFGTKGSLRSPAHITLHMPFLFEEKKEDVLLECLHNFQFSSSFLIQLLNFNCFEPRVVFLDVKENLFLVEFQKKLVNHIKKELHIFNQSDDMRGFHPHVTVAFRDLKKPVFYQIWEECKSQNFSNDFNCSSFSLLKQIDDLWVNYKEINFF
jgi:2'-5' RNA ligase